MYLELMHIWDQIYDLGMEFLILYKYCLIIFQNSVRSAFLHNNVQNIFIIFLPFIQICNISDDIDINAANNIFVELKKGEIESSLLCSLDGDKCFTWNKTSRADAFR